MNPETKMLRHAAFLLMFSVGTSAITAGVCEWDCLRSAQAASESRHCHGSKDDQPVPSENDGCKKALHESDSVVKSKFEVENPSQILPLAAAGSPLQSQILSFSVSPIFGDLSPPPIHSPVLRL